MKLGLDSARVVRPTASTTRAFAGYEFRVVDPESVSVRHYSPQYWEEREPPMLSLWPGIKPTDTVVDVGAAFGAYALPALAMGAFVIAVEPWDDGRRILERNIALNAWGQRCLVLHDALYDGDALPEALAGEVFGKHYVPDGGLDSVRTTTIDEVCASAKALGIGRIDWIKIDVEGLELGVLQGARETLIADHPTLIVEDHDSCNPGHPVSDWPASFGSSEKCLALLRECGYEPRTEPWGESGRKFIVAERK